MPWFHINMYCVTTVNISIEIRDQILFYFVLLWRFISSRQTLRRNTKIQLKNHLSIAVAKSSPTETPNRVYAKLGMPFQSDTS